MRLVGKQMSKQMTVEEFDRFAYLPENLDKTFEYIGGEAIEVPSAPYASAIASNVLFYLGNFVRLGHLGHITGENGGYVVTGERYAPNITYISEQRQPHLPKTGYVSYSPDLVVEILSPADSMEHIRIKIANYLGAGMLVWLVLPETQEVEIYAPGQPMKRVGLDGTLDGGKVLPDFKLAVMHIFAG